MTFEKATPQELEKTKNNLRLQIEAAEQFIETATTMRGISEEFKQYLQEELETLKFRYSLYK